MNVTHELVVIARCPVNNQVDEYECTVETDRTIFVELILETAATYQNQRICQEDLTRAMAVELEARVTTVGRHSGVRTTVVASP